MLACRLKHKPALGAESNGVSAVVLGCTKMQRGYIRARSKKEDHTTHSSAKDACVAAYASRNYIHQSVRKPHFSAVDNTITDALDEREHVVILWIKDDVLDRFLFGISHHW